MIVGYFYQTSHQVKKPDHSVLSGTEHERLADPSYQLKTFWKYMCIWNMELTCYELTMTARRVNV